MTVFASHVCVSESSERPLYGLLRGLRRFGRRVPLLGRFVRRKRSAGRDVGELIHMLRAAVQARMIVMVRWEANRTDLWYGERAADIVIRRQVERGVLVALRGGDDL